MNAPEKCTRCGAKAGLSLPPMMEWAGTPPSLIHEFDCGSRHKVFTNNVRDSIFIQSPNCVVAERDALRAELAALKAENERLTTNAFNLSSLIEEVAEKAGILSDGMPANDDATERLEIRGDGWSIEGMQGLLVEYVAALKAERAGMVTREVALEAAIHAWSHGRLRFAGGGDPRFKLNPKHLWKEGVAAPNGNEREYREACECAEVVLARAEAEAGKDGG